MNKDENTFVSYLTKIGEVALKVVLIALLILLIQLPLSFTVGYMQNGSSKDLLVPILIFLGTSGLLCGVWFLYKKVSHDLPVQWTSKDIMKDIGLFLAMRILVTLISISFISGQTKNDTAIASFIPKDKSSLYFILFVLILMFVGPILEELVFRGILINLFFKDQFKWLAILVSGLVFSSMHLSDSVASFLLYFLMGAIFAFAYTRKRNIRDSILIHILNNMLAAYALLFLI